MKKSVIGMTAAAALLLGMAACGNKTDKAAADENISVEEQEMAFQAATPEESEQLKEELEQQDKVEGEKAGGEDLNSGYITTPSGLKYKVIKKGNGKMPKATDIVKVNYEGKLTDGTVFDSSYQRGMPAEFPLNRVIAGWTEGVQLMPEGSVYEFYIPYDLAYGKDGGGPIPPEADLIFKVELIEVK